MCHAHLSGDAGPLLSSPAGLGVRPTQERQRHPPTRLPQDETDSVGSVRLTADRGNGGAALRGFAGDEPRRSHTGAAVFSHSGIRSRVGSKNSKGHRSAASRSAWPRRSRRLLRPSRRAPHRFSPTALCDTHRPTWERTECRPRCLLITRQEQRDRRAITAADGCASRRAWQQSVYFHRSNPQNI
jgi:hypothetical protein